MSVLHFPHQKEATTHRTGFRLEAEKLATECRMKLYRTSVKEDLNVGVVFQHLAENYVNQVVWIMMVMGRVNYVKMVVMGRVKMIFFQSLPRTRLGR